MNTVDLFVEIDDALNDAFGLSLQDRKDKRMADCMKNVVIITLPNGGRRITKWRCRDPRCETCNEIKGNEYKNRILNEMSKGTKIWHMSLDKNTCNVICKKLGKANYLRFPGEYTDALFISFGEGEYNLTEQDVEEINWASLVKRDTSRIISGSLGKDKKKSDKPYSIYVTDLVVPGTFPVVQIITEIAKSMRYTQPHTEYEFSELHEKYMNRISREFVLNDIPVILSLNHPLYYDGFDIDFLDIRTD